MESPKHRRIAAYQAMRKEGGSGAVEELKEAVRNEYMRKVEWKTNKGQKT